MKISIVLGAGFGDEGKGNFVNHLCKENPGETAVVRFNGGHQAGHTVIHNGKRHVFSNFGSGTLQNVTTYWSKYCTVYPPGFNREYNALIDLGITPNIVIDDLCPVTTPFDIFQNRSIEEIDQHGSCGVGYGQTMYRHESLDHSYRIFVKDLFNKWVLRQKLNQLAKFYNNFDVSIDAFMDECEQFGCRMWNTNVRSMDMNYEHLIFEGAQGILLDREHGIFPHVTRSHTTSKNVMSFIDENKIDASDTTLYYMTRCYSTRHGNGPFFDFIAQPNNANETNIANPYQGSFRIAPFFSPNLRYAITSDLVYNHHFDVNRRVVVTCMDQFEDKIPVIKDDLSDIIELSKDEFVDRLFLPNRILVDRPDF